DRARSGQVHVITGLVDGDTPSTKAARKVLESVSAAKRLLLVLTRDEDVDWVSARNLPNVHILSPDQLNTYDVLVNDDVIFSKSALEAFLGGPVKVGKATATEGEAAAEAPEAAKPAKKAKAESEPEHDEVTDFGPGSHL